MSQKHYSQQGTFHITTNAKNKIPWLTYDRVPEILIDNLIMTRNVYEAKVYAFCILPDHMHILMSPGERGLSDFMQSLKRNSACDINTLLRRAGMNDNLRSAGSITRASHPGLGAGVCEPQLREKMIVKNDMCFHWQNGFHDELIRDSIQRSSATEYIQWNAVRHELVASIDDWPWSSVHFTHLLDPMELRIDGSSIIS